MTTTTNTTPWDCSVCEDGTRPVLPGTMFLADADDTNAQHLDDTSAKRYFGYPFDSCPVCGRPHGDQP